VISENMRIGFQSVNEGVFGRARLKENSCASISRDLSKHHASQW